MTVRSEPDATTGATGTVTAGIRAALLRTATFTLPAVTATAPAA
ncbi:hypothetical protein [Actinoplanes flavus]|nr:hypothetical protein [Actinoplanes flavus]